MDAPPPNLPPEALAAVRAYLAMKVERPGRSRLYPEGFEEYGPSLTGLARCVHPLIFDTGIEGAEYGISGTCFLAKYRGQLFVITAGHCLAAGNGNDLRIALNTATKSFLPLRQMHRAQSNPPNQDFADVAILEATPELLSTDEQRDLFVLDLDQLLTAEMLLKTEAKLVVPGFPKCLNKVDYDRFVIHTQRYLPSGNYERPTERKGVHLMSLDEMEKVESGDGMSGSPVLFVEEHPEAHYFGFLGMVIKGSKFWLQNEFIAAPVIYQMLDQIIREDASGKPASAPA